MQPQPGRLFSPQLARHYYWLWLLRRTVALFFISFPCRWKEWGGGGGGLKKRFAMLWWHNPRACLCWHRKHLRDVCEFASKRRCSFFPVWRLFVRRDSHAYQWESTNSPSWAGLGNSGGSTRWQNTELLLKISLWPSILHTSDVKEPQGCKAATRRPPRANALACGGGVNLSTLCYFFFSKSRFSSSLLA